MEITIPYYEDNTRISNSAIGWFIKYGPAYLKDMLDGKEEGLNGEFLKKGTMIHEYLLQPEEFWKDYSVIDSVKPRSKQQKDFCEYYVNTTELEQDKQILEAYKKAFSNTKTDKQILSEGKDLLEKNADYLNYLTTKESNKIEITFNDIRILKEIKENIKDHKKANELLFNLPESFECHNEFQINWESKEGVPCKSLLDRVCFDLTNKKVILIDLKTTQSVYQFKHSIEEYDYFRQIAFYGLAITWYLTNVVYMDPEEFEFESYIIVIDKTKRNEIKVIDMSIPTQIDFAIKTIKENLQKIAKHISSNQWRYSLEYENGNGVEKLY